MRFFYSIIFDYSSSLHRVWSYLSEKREMTPIPITCLSEEDRPREKFQFSGKHSLTNSELLAIILGSGYAQYSALALSQQILSESENELSSLSKKTVAQLTQIKGVGQVKAITILSALELGRRMEQQRVRQIPEKAISSSEDVYLILKSKLSDLAHEEFWVVYLSQAHVIQRYECLSRGGITGTVADIRLILSRALELKSTSIVLVHNHPSGQLRPSQADIDLTQKASSASSLMDIKILDHLIISKHGYFSFADEGYIS